MKQLFLVAGMVFAQAVVSAAPVTWVDWTAGSAGNPGTATGTLTIGLTTVTVNFTGEISFLQTAGGNNYWIPSAPYISGLVDNAPPDPDIIALNLASTRTLTFSQAVDNLFFAVVSLNGNGYAFDHDFDIVSGNGVGGYWGSGTLTKNTSVPGVFELDGSGEPHGVIRFNQPVSSITWTSLSNENWNGFTVGTYGLAPDETVPEPSTWAMGLAGIAFVGVGAWKRKSRA